MGINLLLDISRQSFRSLDTAMNVVSQNVANAGTEGYHRRQIELTPLDIRSQGTLGGAGSALIGGGVRVSSYERVRDALLDHSRWEARGSLSYANEQSRVLAAVESLFPSGQGSLNEALDQFWNGWSDVADHPTDVGVRLSLRGRAESLISRFNDLDTSLTRMNTDAVYTLQSRVEEANTLLNEISELNVRVAHMRNAGRSDPGAEDQRDMKLERLAELLPATFEEQTDGSTNVYVQGMNLVQLAEVMELTLDTTGSSPSLTYGSTGVAFSSGPDGGEIGALMGPVLDEIAQTRTDLDDMVEAVVAAVNTAHAAGYGSDGATGRDFFNAAGIAAGSMALSADVASDPAAIAAGSDAAAVGDNANALSIHDLRYANLMAGGTQTVSDFAVDTVSRIGAGVATARARAAGAESTVANLDAMSQATSGVSIDDEMVSLIKLQQTYAATARLLQTTNEMFTTLLSI